MNRYQLHREKGSQTPSRYVAGYWEMMLTVAKADQARGGWVSNHHAASCSLPRFTKQKFMLLGLLAPVPVTALGDLPIPFARMVAFPEPERGIIPKRQYILPKDLLP